MVLHSSSVLCRKSGLHARLQASESSTEIFLHLDVERTDSCCRRRGPTLRRKWFDVVLLSRRKAAGHACNHACDTRSSLLGSNRRDIGRERQERDDGTQLSSMFMMRRSSGRSDLLVLVMLPNVTAEGRLLRSCRRASSPHDRDVARDVCRLLSIRHPVPVKEVKGASASAPDLRSRLGCETSPV